jgi:hypothetical protein
MHQLCDTSYRWPTENCLPGSRPVVTDAGEVLPASEVDSDLVELMAQLQRQRRDLRPRRITRRT